MDIIQIQYLEKPFDRVVGNDVIYKECNSFEPPSKPYFKGTNDIPENHPSIHIRQLIKQFCTTEPSNRNTYPGNLKRSNLHEHEDALKLVNEQITNGINNTWDSTIEIVNKTEYRMKACFSNNLIVLPFRSSQFIIPPNCGFYNGDVLHYFKEKQDYKYDIIEMDPPWPNKSNQRANIYNTRCTSQFSIHTMFETIPLDKLCNDQCYILVWITNDPSCMESTMRFFADRGITHITTAYWIKTTEDKECVVPLSCPNRETVVVGKYYCNEIQSEKRQRITIEPLKDKLLHNVYQLSGKRKGESAIIATHECQSAIIKKVPFIVSTVSFHSRKPDCTQYKHLPKEYKGLELFSRQLRSNWYSVGDQVLLFQNNSILKCDKMLPTV